MSVVAKTVRTRGEEPRNKPVAFRLTQSEHDEIDRRAKKRNMTMTEYVVKACLGELPVENERVLADHEERIVRLERMADLGAFG